MIESEKKNSVNIYPNPLNNSVLKIDYKNLKNSTFENIQLKNLNGSIIKNFPTGKNKTEQLVLENVAAGTYLLYFEGNKESFSTKLVITN
jgi:hypothetical protein